MEDGIVGARKFPKFEPVLRNFQSLVLAYPNYQAQFNYFN